MDEETLDSLIRQIITSVKPYANKGNAIEKYFGVYYKLTNAWDEFLEQASSPFSVIDRTK